MKALKATLITLSFVAGFILFLYTLDFLSTNYKKETEIVACITIISVIVIVFLVSLWFSIYEKLK